MKTQLARALATILIVLFSLSPVWATCGGGGGGGTGGVGGGNKTDGFCPLAWDTRSPRNLSVEQWTPKAFDSGNIKQDPPYKWQVLWRCW